MSDPSKDTIYIDIDDEITTIIDKVRGSSHKLVALVLPKRAAVLQSVVNMKLLKKTADSEKKNVVLITSEAGLLPLAGSVGLYVAKTLQTKPALPDAPEIYDDTDAVDEPLDVGDEPSEFDPKDVADKPVGELAGKSAEPVAASYAASEAPKKPLDADETIDLNEDELAASGTIAEARAENKKNKGKNGKKDKHLKVPDFIRFRRLLILGVLLIIVIIVALVLVAKILPKAKISIQTSNQNVNSNLTLSLSTSTTQLNSASLTVPATQQQITKTVTAQVSTTGTQNNGAEAAGTVTMIACESSAQLPPDVPAGTGITSNGLTFVTQADTSFSHHGTNINGTCISYQANGPTSVTAQSGGSKYNLAPSTFTVAGRSDVTATSNTAFSGGTDSIIQTVAPNDPSSATAKLTAPTASTISQQLQSQITQAGLVPITATFTTGSPTITTSPSVGTQANNVTASETIVYTMLGVHQSDLTTLIDNSVNSQINSSQQSIVSTGISNATYNALSTSNGQAQVTMATTSVVGSQIDVSSIKKKIIGKRSGDVKSIIDSLPGVKSVTVHFSPFWVSSVPSNPSKTTISVINQGS